MEERFIGMGMAVLIGMLTAISIGAVSLWATSITTAKAYRTSTQIQAVIEDISTTAVNWAIKNGGKDGIADKDMKKDMPIDEKNVKQVIQKLIDKQNLHEIIVDIDDFEIEIKPPQGDEYGKDHTDQTRGDVLRITANYRIPQNFSRKVGWFSYSDFEYINARPIITEGVIHRYRNNLD